MITAVVLTKNEEENIQRCLKALRWCKEIIVIDDYSSDKTIELAKKEGAKIYRQKLNNNFGQQRNFGLKKANQPWVLFVDADEVVPPTLAQEIVRRVEKGKADGFLLPRVEIFAGKQLIGVDKPSWDWSWGPIWLLRLARRDKGEWHGAVHEIWQVKGKVLKIKQPLYHYSFTNLTVALRKINYYSNLAAQQLQKENKKALWWQIVFYPGAKFVKSFFWHRGFQAGTTGLIFCLLISLQSFLIRAKLWQKQQEKK